MPTTQHMTSAALLLALGLSSFSAIAQDDPPAASTADHAADIAASDDGDGDGLFVDPGPGPDNPNDEPAPRVEGEDLPIGDTLEIDADQATFRFHADGPGMLTLLAYAPGDRTRIQLQIKDAQGRLYDLDFLVIQRGKKYQVIENIVHAINGKKRKYHLEG